MVEIRKIDNKTGKVSGKIIGVNQRILNILFLVSAHYAKTIDVVSGMRDKKEQASAMFKGWESHLKKGKIYIFLGKNEKMRLELDAFVRAKDQVGFINYMMDNAPWKSVSYHMTGDAVDVSLATDGNIIKALATVLHYFPESNTKGIKCHHFDTRKIVWPINDKVKGKWAI